MGKSKNSKYYIEDDEFEHVDHKKIFTETRKRRKDKEKSKELNISNDDTDRKASNSYWNE